MDPIIENEIYIDFHSIDTSEEEAQNKKKMEQSFPTLKIEIEKKEEEEEEDDSLIDPFEDDSDSGFDPVELAKKEMKKRSRDNDDDDDDDDRNILEQNFTFFAKWMLYQCFYPQDIPPPNENEDSPELLEDKNRAAQIWIGFTKFMDALERHQQKMFTHFKSEISTRSSSTQLLVFYAGLQKFQELRVVKDNNLILNPCDEDFPPSNTSIIRKCDEEFDLWHENAIPEPFYITVSSKKASLMLQYHHNIYHMVHYISKDLLLLLPQPEQVVGLRFHQLWEKVTESSCFEKDAMKWPLEIGVSKFVSVISQWRQRLFHSFNLL